MATASVWAIPAEEPSSPPPPSPTLQGTTCRFLDAVGQIATERLLVAREGVPRAAADCVAGERVELSVELMPQIRYQLRVLLVPPVLRARAMLEVHPQVASLPLVADEVVATGGESTMQSLPQGGMRWDGPRRTPARVVVTVDEGEGVVGVALQGEPLEP